VYPVVLKVVDRGVQILLECLVITLSPSVCLQMACGSKVSVDVQVVAECCPKVWDELKPAIGNNAQRYTSA
jgi:hypothetical protein